MPPLLTALSPWLAGYAALLSLLAFAAMGLDKARSKQKGARRIPEKRLFLLALLGGSPGALAGMLFFRHKTRHWYFMLGMPLILLVQLALLARVFLVK